MKLSKQDKRRLKEIFEMQGSSFYSGMSFDEMAEQRCFSVAAAQKIRGTYNKIQKIATEWNIDRYEAIEYVNGNIYSQSTLLLFLLMNFRNTEMSSVDLAQLISETTGNFVSSYDIQPMLHGLNAWTQCNPISYTTTNDLDCLIVK